MTALMKKTRGFSLVSAIFLLVVIAGLGAVAVTVSTTQHQSSAMDVQGARAYQAARAGIEWGAFQVLRGGAFRATCEAGAASQPLGALPGTLAGFAVTVQCTHISTTESDRTVRMYRITATATQGTPATASYIERQLSATIGRHD